MRDQGGEREARSAEVSAALGRGSGNGRWKSGRGRRAVAAMVAGFVVGMVVGIVVVVGGRRGESVGREAREWRTKEREDYAPEREGFVLEKADLPSQ